MDLEIKGSEYICRECYTITILKPKDPIRCENCGRNMLFKSRNRLNPVQLQAR